MGRSVGGPVDIQEGHEDPEDAADVEYTIDFDEDAIG